MPLDEMPGNIKLYVEAKFRVSVDRERRTIGGFSRGGGSLHVARHYLSETLRLHFE
jgi:hypothetical protein